MSDSEFEYIVVGSGAGGGPLAANLARAGFRVLLMEAGGDPCSEDDTGRFLYEVPVFHGRSTEHEPCAWNFFVRHYTDDRRQDRDTKAKPIDGKKMVWYPRAGMLGGCTAHNAMIMVAPQASDWNHIAKVTGDKSWRADHMRQYFSRLENCTYVNPPGSIRSVVNGILSSIIGLVRGSKGRFDLTNGHGFKGWLTTSMADPRTVVKDPELDLLILKSTAEILQEHIGDPLTRILSHFDPNDIRNAEKSPEGLAFTPMSVDKGRRVGPRDYLLRTRKEFPDRLTIKQHALATRILFQGTRATGVEYIDRAHVYRADPRPIDDPGSLPRSEVRATREVIISGGAFNSPQMLMLSGVGPREELERFAIPVVVDLPGVGQNLQDRYEIGIISEFAGDFSLIKGATFAPPENGGEPDAFLKEWTANGTGVYASNGALIGIIKRSRKDLLDPDLYIFGLPGYFKGYYPGYSKEFAHYHNRFTWAILKARTQNTGQVRLASPHPWDRPEINFKYFGDGAREADPDLEAMVEGVRLVREMNERLMNLKLITKEETPGLEYRDEDLREFIRNEAWGHHASCTNKIGADGDPMAVLDSRFRVRGTQGLRVVDASVFPKIPGFFIVSAVYMISEKATDVIVEDAGVKTSKPTE